MSKLGGQRPRSCWGISVSDSVLIFVTGVPILILFYYAHNTFLIENICTVENNLLKLYFYKNEPSKNKHFLILLSSLARNSQEPKLKRIFEIPWVLFEKSLGLYFDWPELWIWRTLEKVMNIFCKWHFHNATKEVFWQKKNLNFMHGFRSAILA